MILIVIGVLMITFGSVAGYVSTLYEARFTVLTLYCAIIYAVGCVDIYLGVTL